MTSPSVYGTGPVGWSITGQRSSVQLDGMGQLADGMEVSFRTTDGDTGTVWVPLVHYDAPTVRDLVAQRVAQLAQVRRLTHES